jgi:hypothetical protein
VDDSDRYSITDAGQAALAADQHERAMDLAQDDAHARARETRFAMADFEDDDGQLPAERSSTDA